MENREIENRLNEIYNGYSRQRGTGGSFRVGKAT